MTATFSHKRGHQERCRGGNGSQVLSPSHCMLVGGHTAESPKGSASARQVGWEQGPVSKALLWGPVGIHANRLEVLLVCLNDSRSQGRAGWGMCDSGQPSHTGAPAWLVHVLKACLWGFEAAGKYEAVNLQEPTQTLLHHWYIGIISIYRSTVCICIPPTEFNYEGIKYHFQEH